MKLLKTFAVIVFIIFFPGMLIILFELAFPYQESQHKIETFNNHPKYYSIHTHGGYEHGKVGDFNDDGQSDFISSYGCVFISGSHAGSNVPSCEMSPQDANKQAVFPAASPHVMDLKPDQVTQFNQYQGQQYMVFRESGSKYFTIPGQEGTVPHPVFQPYYYENYFETIDGKTNIVVEYGLTDVERFEVQSDGSLVKTPPTAQQKLRAFSNWHTHLEKSLYFPSIFYVIASFFVAIATVVVLVITGMVMLVKRFVLKNKIEKIENKKLRNAKKRSVKKKSNE